MKEFFDTSVLAAAFWGGHRDHGVSLRLLAARPAIPPEQVLLFLQAARERLAVVTLDEQDYIDTIERTAELGFTGGRIYDALLLRCAAKVKASTTYTWNLKHFLAIDPGQAERMRTP